MTAWRLVTMPRLAAAIAAFAVLSHTERARCSDFELVWDAPAECPAGEAVRQVLLQRLGPHREGLALKATAKVTRRASSFRVKLSTYRNRQRGVRELEAPTCEALVDAISVIVALAVDPELVERDSGSSGALDGAGGAKDGSTSLEATPARASEPLDEDRSADSAASGETETEPDAQARAFTELGLQGLLSVAGTVESGVLPGLGFGLTLRGGARLRRFRVEAALSRWFLRRTASARTGSGADVEGLGLSALGCFRAVPAHTAAVPRLRSALPSDDSPAIEAGPCLGAEVGNITGRSVGVSEPSEGTGSYAAVGGALRVGATAADWLSLDVRFEAFRMVHRPDFRVQNLGVVHEPSAWSLRAALGAEAYFP